MRTHLLIVSSHYWPSLGGLQQYLLQFTRALDASGDFDITVFTLHEGKMTRERVNDRVRVIRLPAIYVAQGIIGIPNPFSWFRAAFSIHRNKPVHCISTHTRFFLTSLFAVFLSRWFGVPMIHTEHGSDYVQSENKVIRWGARIYDEIFGAWVLRRAQRVIAIAPKVEEFVRRLSRRAPVLIPTGIDLDEWDPKRVQPLADEQTRWVAGRLVFVFSGRIVEGKGWRRVLEAWLGVRDDLRARSCVVFLGNGPDLAVLKHHIEARGVEHSVLALGFQHQAEVRKWLCGNVYVNASVLAEGNQLTVLEAAALGCWQITTPVGTAAEYTEAGGGVLIDPQDWSTLTRAMQDAIENRKKSKSREYIASRYSWKKAVAEFEAQVRAVTLAKTD